MSATVDHAAGLWAEVDARAGEALQVEKLLQAGTLKQVLKTGIGAQIVCA